MNWVCHFLKIWWNIFQKFNCFIFSNKFYWLKFKFSCFYIYKIIYNNLNIYTRGGHHEASGPHAALGVMLRPTEMGQMNIIVNLIVHTTKRILHHEFMSHYHIFLSLKYLPFFDKLIGLSNFTINILLILVYKGKIN